MNNISAFPLTWPPGWKRTETRKRSKFAKKEFCRARDELFRELKNLGVSNSNVILSSNLPLRKDGLPYSGMANPTDSGIAVYFKYRDRDMVFACDCYISVTENMWAVTKTIEALRGIERWGASDMLERSFMGFEALPAPKTEQWFEVLGVSKNATRDEIRSAWRDLVFKFHPDRGGSAEQMDRVNKARKEGMGE